MAQIIFFNALRRALDKTENSNVFLKVKQINALFALWDGRDVLAVLPTGYGKSIIFELAPFLYEEFKTVIVVAPLNAIMMEQKQKMEKAGIKCCVLKATSNLRLESYVNIDSDSESDEEDISTDPVITPSHIVFVHPEGIVSDRTVRNTLLASEYQKRVVACFVDEAHCIQEWGKEFRQDYGKLAILGSLFPKCPIIALTASAPPACQMKIMSSLQMKKTVIVKGDLNRENIFYQRQERPPTNTGCKGYESLLLPMAYRLLELGIDHPLTVVYLPLKWCGFAYKLFSSVLGNFQYFPIDRCNPSHRLFAQFHSPQTEVMKSELLCSLIQKESCARIIFATVAMGMGVNIPNIRHVIHIGPPRTLESLYQETGRAGRDGLFATATLYYNNTDLSKVDEEVKEYCLSYNCLRSVLLGYFDGGQQTQTGRENRCLSHACCSVCSTKCQCVICDSTLPIALNDNLCNFTNMDVENDELLLSRKRLVTDKDRQCIYNALLLYRIKICQKGCFGGIDISTGFSIKLIEDVVDKCEFMVNECDVSKNVNVWSSEHASKIFEIISANSILS